jgi:hypothetical protein
VKYFFSYFPDFFSAKMNFYEINLKLNGTNSIDQVDDDDYSEFDSDSVTLKYFKER